jgi:hypothetical protein
VVILTLLIKCSSNISAEVEANSLFVEVTLQKTYNQNYGNKLHLDYAAFEDNVEKAVSAYNIQTNLIFTISDKSFPHIIQILNPFDLDTTKFYCKDQEIIW